MQCVVDYGVLVWFYFVQSNVESFSIGFVEQLWCLICVVLKVMCLVVGFDCQIVFVWGYKVGVIDDYWMGLGL